MKEHPILFSAPMVRALLADRKSVTRRLSPVWMKVKAGDRLWVRETWAIHSQPQEGQGIGYWLQYRADEELVKFQWDGSVHPRFDQWWHKAADQGWKPSIHMHRECSRILLECEEDARMERLQDITEDESLCEGVSPMVVSQDDIDDAQSGGEDAIGKLASAFGPGSFTAKFEFMMLWSTLHTKPGERWEDNPTVYRVGKFRRIA